MKQLFIIVALFSFTLSAFAQSDSAEKPVVIRKPAAIKKITTIDTGKKSIDTSKSKTAAMVQTVNVNAVDKSLTEPKKDCGCIPRNNIVSNFEWLLVFMPFLVFVAIFLLIGRPKDFKFAEALSENDQSLEIVKNENYKAVLDPTLNPSPSILSNPNIGALLPPTIEVSKDDHFRPSISRYIAFITSLLTITVALGMSCFFIFHYIRSGCPPDLSNFTVILVALGIGISPYLFNKISAAVAANK